MNNKIKFNALVNENVSFKKIDFSLSEIFAMYKSEEIVIQNKLVTAQREYEEWTEEKLESFLNILKSGFPPQPIYLIEISKRLEVLDGQHRIMAIDRLFTSNKISASDDFPMITFIIIKPRVKSFSKIKDIATEFFIMINTTSLEVHRGTILRLGIKNKNKKIFNIIDTKYKEHFKEGKKDQKEYEFEMAANIIYIQTQDTKDYISKTNLGNELLEHFSDDESLSSTVEKDFRRFVDKMIELKIYGNAENKQNSKPIKKFLLAFVLLEKDGFFKDMKTKTFKEILSKVANLVKEDAWKMNMKGKRGQMAPVNISKAFQLYKKDKEEKHENIIKSIFKKS